MIVIYVFSTTEKQNEMAQIYIFIRYPIKLETFWVYIKIVRVAHLVKHFIKLRCCVINVL